MRDKIYYYRCLLIFFVILFVVMLCIFPYLVQKEVEKKEFMFAQDAVSRAITSLEDYNISKEQYMLDDAITELYVFQIFLASLRGEHELFVYHTVVSELRNQLSNKSEQMLVNDDLANALIAIRDDTTSTEGYNLLELVVSKNR